MLTYSMVEQDWQARSFSKSKLRALNLAP